MTLEMMTSAVEAAVAAIAHAPAAHALSPRERARKER
jgi:hypothetical protein